jgi:uncharacterized protein (TIGR02271 family)
MAKQTKKRDETNATTGRTVVGMFTERKHAEQAIHDLKDMGFNEDQIGVAMRDRSAQSEVTKETGTQAAEGATAGLVSGGVLGGLVGLLVGAGALAIPGIGPVIAGGALASAFGVAGGTAVAGAGIGAATGGILGALIGMGIPDEDARHFERGFKEGGILVTVNAGTRTDEALAVLRRNGADIGPSSRLATGAAGVGTVEAATGMRNTADTARDRTNLTDQERLQLREEELNVSKERVQAGEVRVRKEVVTEQQQVDVPVTREEVVIERHPVAGHQTAGGNIAAGAGEEVRIPLTEEQVRVNKDTVVREEVTLGKRKVEDVEHVSDTVRREEARIEGEGEQNIAMRSGAAKGSNRWSGAERRMRRDRSYTGPERRLVGA